MLIIEHPACNRVYIKCGVPQCSVLGTAVLIIEHPACNRVYIKCGVPQGSVLGTAVFLLFISDVCKVSNLIKFVLFADDTNSFCSNKNVEVL